MLFAKKHEQRHIFNQNCNEIYLSSLMPSSFLFGFKAFITLLVLTFWSLSLVYPTFGMDSISQIILPRNIIILLIGWNSILFVSIVIHCKVKGNAKVRLVLESIFFVLSIILYSFAARATTCYSAAKNFFTFPCATWTTGMFLFLFQILLLFIVMISEIRSLRRAKDPKNQIS